MIWNLHAVVLPHAAITSEHQQAMGSWRLTPRSHDCAASIDDLGSEEVEMMQAISATCADEMSPCLGEGNTMVDFALCDRPESACYDAVDACTEVEDNNSTSVDEAECTGAGDCEVVEMEQMVTCAPSASNAVGRVLWDCVLGAHVEMMAPPEPDDDDGGGGGGDNTVAVVIAVGIIAFVFGLAMWSLRLQSDLQARRMGLDMDVQRQLDDIIKRSNGP